MLDKTVDSCIVEKVLPQAYTIIDKLLDAANLPKDLQLEARKLLPGKYKNSILNSGAQKKPKKE
jgi:hypothetical protein